MASPVKLRHRLANLLGEVLITLGVVLALFLVWQNWWTDVQAAHAATSERSKVARDWGAKVDADGIPGPAAPARPNPLPTTPKPSPGQGHGGSHHRVSKKVATIGLLYVPALKKQHLWAQPIVQGTSLRALARGVGHYERSAQFGGIGNAGIAGHRTTHGAPFRHVDDLRRGDHVVIRVRNTWFVYVLDRHKIVRPNQSWVLRNRPFKSNSGRLLTLTTCHPLHSAARRFVWWGHLVRSQPATAGAPIELKAAR
jgi:sortase A